MADVHDGATRSRNMAAIKGTDTKPEMMIRQGLHARGFRYRLHNRALPGRPDLSFSRHRAVIFVNGCFWHGHECDLFRWPKTREDFWRAKIGATVERDTNNLACLKAEDWRVAVIWECALTGKRRRKTSDVIDTLAVWLHSSSTGLHLDGIG